MRAGGQTEGKLERHSGLPAEVSSLVGREPQIAAVLEGLRDSRVVSLTGPGGCGKTRLALRVAALADDSFEDGAWLVELASLTDPALVPGSVAEALGVPERDAANPMAAVVRALADRELLVVLDNCEHVLESAGQLVVTLAGHCRRVRVLTTSRERLDVPGEFVFPVPPLGLPDDDSVCAVGASEAGSLFLARARAASPAFALTAGDAATIAEVCSRLDGMPLAIELAAARCATLGPAQLAARLEGYPGLLSGGAARPRRHRSLEALMSWSYDLLSEAEKRLLARLSVLRGGFDLDLAERVCGGEPLAGDESTAAAAAGEARAELGGRRQAITLATIRYAEGVLAWHRGDLAGAERLVREATGQWHRCGDRMAVSDGIELLGELAAARERYTDAARLLAAAGAARQPLRYLAPGFAANRGAAARAAGQARDVLGEARFTRAWEEGRQLSLDDAVAYAARRSGGRKRPAAGWASLTPAELEVIWLVGEGLRNEAIARRLFIAPGTVKVHLSHIFAKLGITTRAELAAQAAS